MTVTNIVLADRPAELVRPKGVDEDAGDTAVLYLHGGAFLACGPGTHRPIVASLAAGLRVPVFALDYRQLPECGVGTSVHDAVEAYRELVTERGFRHVVVAGDSAGGYLSVKVAELATISELPVPTAAALISPLLDLDLGTRPGRTSRYDAYLPIRRFTDIGPLFDQGPVDFAGERRIHEVILENFPPTVIVTAGREMVEPDSVEFVETLEAFGRRAVLHSFPWQVHAFTVILRHREGRESVGVIVDFLNESIREARRVDDAQAAPIEQRNEAV